MYIEFKPGQKFSASKADTSDDINTFADCGYLLRDDEIAIDIDKLTKESIKQMIDIFDIHTQIVWTDRGAHLYFKKPEGMIRTTKEGICKLGFEIERKTSKNTPKGLTIKRNGIVRTIENEGVREALPSIFEIKKSYQDLNGLSDGDGRNEKLHKHKLALGGCEDWFRILSFINQSVFAEPLGNKEFTSVARQEATDDAKTAEESEVANRLIESRRCCKWGSKLWFWDYDSKSYLSDTEEFKRVVYQYCVGKKTAFVDEVVKQIEYRCHRYPKDHVFKIKLKNGFLKDGEFYPFELDEFTPFAIDLNYNPKAAPVPIVDEYLKQLTTKTEGAGSEKYTEQDFQDYKKVLLESLAFPLIVDPEMTRRLSRFFIFRGDGANGKGTLLQIIKTIYGAENCAYLSIENIGDERYVTSLIGKLVNLGDDVEDSPISKKQFKVIKNITTGDDVEVRYLYKQSEHVQIQAKLMFTSNSDIRTFDKGYALKRRMYWMPMFNKVEKPDPKFITRITSPDALEYWLRLLVEGYKRLYKDGWTGSVICADYNDEYHVHNDLSELFIREVGIQSLIGRTTKEIRETFDEWNTEDDRKLSLKNFKQNIWEIHKAGFGAKKDGGKVSRILMYQTNTTQDLKPHFK